MSNLQALSERIDRLEKAMDNLMTMVFERAKALDNKLDDSYQELEEMINDVRGEIPYDCLTEDDLDDYATVDDLYDLQRDVKDLQERVSDLEQ